MTAFVCTKCAGAGLDPVIRYGSDQYVIEIAAKSNDAQNRAAQVSTHRLCRRHAVEYVEAVRKAWDRKGLHIEQFTGQESLL